MASIMSSTCSNPCPLPYVRVWHFASGMLRMKIAKQKELVPEVGRTHPPERFKVMPVHCDDVVEVREVIAADFAAAAFAHIVAAA